MFEQTIKLIGKPLNDPDLQAFMAEHGYKQPKKAEISGRSSDRSFWVEHKKLAINLLFDIETQNPHYLPFAGSKKGMWLPMLQQIKELIRIAGTNCQLLSNCVAPNFKIFANYYSNCNIN